MKQILMAGAAVLTVMAAPANAAVVGTLSGSAAPNLLTLSSTGLSSGATQVASLSGGTVYTSDQPFADIPQGSIFGNTFLAAGPTSGNVATLSLLVSTNFLSFLWGSPDLYNTLTVSSTTAGVTTSQLFTAATLGIATGPGSASRYVQFSGVPGTTINSVSFNNVPAVDAFESANFSLSAVPEPATWAMMLIGFGGIGFAMRRRKSKVTTTVAYA